MRLQVAGGEPATTATNWRAILGDQRWRLFAALAVLNGFDLLTTAMVLGRGGEERNPFVKPMVDNLWQVGLLKVAILVIVAALLCRCIGSRIAELALAATTGWYLAVVTWNVAVLAIL